MDMGQDPAWEIPFSGRWGLMSKRVPHTSRAFQVCIWVKNQLVEFISVVGKARAWGPYQNKGNTWGSGPGGVAFWLRTATSKVVVHSSLVQIRVLPKAASAKVVLLHSGYGLVQSIKQLPPLWSICKDKTFSECNVPPWKWKIPLAKLSESLPF